MAALRPRISVRSRRSSTRGVQVANLGEEFAPLLAPERPRGGSWAPTHSASDDSSAVVESYDR